MKNIVRTILAVIALFFAGHSSALGLKEHVGIFPVKAVRLAPSPFKDAMLTDMRYILALDPDRLIAPYRKEAGLKPKAENYTNWENTGLDGHIGGHYLSALSYLYAATGDSTVGQRLDYVISELMKCQEAAADGYLCGVPDGRRIWHEISQGDIKADGFSLNGGWVPLYNIHKIYAGLRDAYILTGDTRVLTMLVNLTDWMCDLTSALTDSQIQDMLRSEHGGLNEVFADVAAITGNSKYMNLAIRFSHRSILNPLMAGQDKLTGMHANTQIPKVIGFKRIADLTGDTLMNRAAQFFWDTVVNNRSITIGGNSVREHFHPANDFSSMTESEQGPETCNTYNMLRLSKMLYGTSADTRYMDYYERALYNHILSSQHPHNGGFVYFTPMRPGHYRVYSQPQEGFWCCVGSGMENHARYGEMIYGHSADTLYVNLFIPSDLDWDGTAINQRNNFPEENATTLTIKPGKHHRTFTLKVRVPQWTDASRMTISVNGVTQPAEIHDGYLSLRRRWRKSDTLKVTLPMSLHAEDMPDGSPYASFMYGPIVLASRMGTDNLTGLYADDSRGGHIASGPKMPKRQIPAIIGNRDSLTSHITAVPGQPLTFALHGLSIPEYEGMILEPFYRIHDSRYMVYWPVYSAREWDEIRSRTEAEDRQRAVLDSITADMVVCGEQQPESDHFISADDSRAGDDNGRHWREAKGSFSYMMRNDSGNISELRFLFHPKASRKATVTVGDSIIGIIDGADTCGIIRLPIPESIRTCSPLKVTISSYLGQTTPRIYEVRALTTVLPTSRLVKIAGNGYGNTSVNTAIFRTSPLATHGDRQYTAYYDANGYLTLGVRETGSDKWTIRRSRYRGNAADAHNVISLTVDGDGYLHVAFDHHGHKLKYCRGTTPGSLRLGPLESMTGMDEDDVTYPEFYTLRDGSILFAYRSGASGRGNLVMNRYDTATRSWSRLHTALIDGENQRNAYWQIHVDTAGTIHLSWVWRESWLVETNHDLCYARSRDNGASWERSDGIPYTLPITVSNAEYAMHIPQNSELINQTSMSADSQGHPYIATYWRDPDSDVPQYRMVWHDGRQWNSRRVGHRSTPFTLSGGGTKMIPVSRPRMVVDGDKVFYLFRDTEHHSQVSMAYTSGGTSSGEWIILPLTSFSVNAWEPTFDAELWRTQQKLHIFVQPSFQGDGERTVSAAPQPVYVLEISR